MFIMLMKGEKWQHGLLVLGQDQYKEHTKVPDKPAGRAVLGPLCCTAPGNVLLTSGVSWSLQLRATNANRNNNNVYLLLCSCLQSIICVEFSRLLCCRSQNVPRSKGRAENKMRLCLQDSLHAIWFNPLTKSFVSVHPKKNAFYPADSRTPSAHQWEGSGDPATASWLVWGKPACVCLTQGAPTGGECSRDLPSLSCLAFILKHSLAIILI